MELIASGNVSALGPEFLQPDTLIASFGTYALIGIVLIVFIETGLLFPFLPGDSLLFTAGMLVAQDSINVDLWLLCVMLFVAAFVGDQVAYFIGRRIGPRLFQNPDARILRPEYLKQTQDYFDRYGGRTIIIARFVPFVRTFAPVAAGMGRMNYRHFVTFNVVGAFVWGVGVTVLGYFLGQISFVHENIEYMLILIVALSMIPVVVEILRNRKERRKAAEVAALTPAEAATEDAQP